MIFKIVELIIRNLNYGYFRHSGLDPESHIKLQTL